ncbi:hypothetical protein AVEN_28678-1, partial [Araneus ventricosus]
MTRSTLESAPPLIKLPQQTRGRTLTHVLNCFGDFDLRVSLYMGATYYPAEHAVIAK